MAYRKTAATQLFEKIPLMDVAPIARACADMFACDAATFFFSTVAIR